AEHGAERGGKVGAGAHALEQLALAGLLARLYHEGTYERADDADDGDGQGQEHVVPAVARGGADGKGGEDGADVALVEVRAHARDVADVVADVVRDGGGVARVVLGYAGLDLADEVRADVGGLGEDAAAHAGEARRAGGAHAEHDHGVGYDGGEIGRASCRGWGCVCVGA